MVSLARGDCLVVFGTIVPTCGFFVATVETGDRLVVRGTIVFLGVASSFEVVVKLSSRGMLATLKLLLSCS